MDAFYVGLLADSLRVPDTYLDEVEPQEAGSMMLALTYFRHVTVGARVSIETKLYQHARGGQRGFYQYLITLKNWAEKSPYERPWSLSPHEFNQAVKQVAKGDYPEDMSEAWWLRNMKWVMAAIGVAGAVTFMLPAEEAAAAAAALGTISKGTAGAGGALTLAEGFKILTGMASVERAYAMEARRRSYRPSI
jgi:hypothetical protein